MAHQAADLVWSSMQQLQDDVRLVYTLLDMLQLVLFVYQEESNISKRGLTITSFCRVQNFSLRQSVPDHKRNRR